MVCNFICEMYETITVFKLRLKIWCLYDHYLQCYTLMFIQCAIYNFTEKWLLQFKTKDFSVYLQEKWYSTRTFVQRIIAYGFLREVSMSYSTAESPLVWNSVNTRVGMSSCSFMICYLGTEYHGGRNFHREALLLLGDLFKLTIMLFQISCVGLSQGNLQDIPLISRVCYSDSV